MNSHEIISCLCQMYHMFYTFFVEKLNIDILIHESSKETYFYFEIYAISHKYLFVDMGNHHKKT